MPSEAVFDAVLREVSIFRGDGARVDIAMSGGGIAALGAGLARGKTEVECDGAYVSAAWVDAHIHLLSQATPGRIDALAYGPSQGVGALVDAGSAPPARLDELINTRPWVFALANIDSNGIRRAPGAVPEISGRAADDALAGNPARVRGIKVQASQSVLGGLALEAIENAIGVAERHRVTVMVHVGNPPPALGDVCDLLRPGDIITHYAHGKAEGATLADGTPLPALRRAYERGVLLDVGHGRSSFSFRRFRDLVAAGIKPATIGTDLHGSSAEYPVVSLARTMSKMLALGLGLDEVVTAVTGTPARVFGLDGYGGKIEAGAPARLTVFRLESREVEVFDSLDQPLVLKQWLQPLGCFLDGAWYAAEMPV